MSKENERVQRDESKGTYDEKRREFLRTSMYAAYATPVIMSMLVEKASAASSGSSNCSDPDWAEDHPNACN